MAIENISDLKIRIGTDICSIERIRKAYQRFGERFLSRILTETEIAYVLSSRAHTSSRIAGRFAVKEACAKALGVGWRGISFTDIEVVRESSGKPSLRLHGRAATLARSLNLNSWEITLSHEHEFATAFVLAHN